MRSTSANNRTFLILVGLLTKSRTAVLASSWMFKRVCACAFICVVSITQSKCLSVQFVGIVWVVCIHAVCVLCICNDATHRTPNNKRVEMWLFQKKRRSKLWISYAENNFSYLPRSIHKRELFQVSRTNAEVELSSDCLFVCHTCGTETRGWHSNSEWKRRQQCTHIIPRWLAGT